jgi:hypothetical protein
MELEQRQPEGQHPGANPGNQQNRHIPGLHDGETNTNAGPLNALDIFSFIVNKMIGTGILLQPSTVLALTRSRGVAITIWIVGFIYTLFR